MSQSWTQPICEQCWIAKNSIIIDSGVAIRTPISVRMPVVEQCAYCGQPTVVGIYVRDNPDSVIYPREKE